MINRIDDAPIDDDLARRFARLERLDAPDTWESATGRAKNGEPSGGSSRRWWGAAAAVALLIGGVVAVAATGGGGDPLRNASTSVAFPAPDTEPVVSASVTDEVPEVEVLPTVSTGAADSIVVPVVEGLTEAEAVRTLRELGLVVLVERVEVAPGDPSAGRVVSQEPLAASSVRAEDGVAIVVGTSVGTADDELATTLVRFGVDLGTAPIEAMTLDGATMCGSEQLDVDGLPSVQFDVDGRRCFLDHQAARLAAVFVSGSTTVEGDPIVAVTRARADGSASQFIDSTRDLFGSGEWEVFACGLPTGTSDSPVALNCPLGPEAVIEPISIDPLPFPDWFGQRTAAPTCGYVASDLSTELPASPLVCMQDAIAVDERGELVTVHTGDGLRVARWIVSLGPNPRGTPQFEVASLVVDLRAGTTRWAETRCVEGELAAGRLVGDFLVDRDFVDQLDPSGTVVTDGGDVIDLPGPDERGALQPCSGPQRVERPDVTPFEATGLRVGDVVPPAERFYGFNELGEYDPTIEPSWAPAGLVGEPGIIGFVRAVGIEPLPQPDDPTFPDGPVVVFADDGVTRVGEFGDGGVILDP